MHVTVRLFARLREIAGFSEAVMEIPDGQDVRALWDALVSRDPALEPYTRSISCAVNEDYARFATGLKDGDEVAFLPPVSGG
jgi:molybdopterin converting factor subunit 1